MQFANVVGIPGLLCLLAVGGPAHADEPTWTPPEPVVAAAPAARVEAAVDSPAGVDADVVEVMGPEPPPPVKAERRKSKRCGKGGKSCKPRVSRAPRETPEELRLRAAATMRAEIVAAADAMVAAGRTAAAADALASAAETYADPVLHVAAVEATLADPKLDRERLRLALQRIETARRLVEQPGEPRIAASEGPALLERGDLLAAYTERRLEGLRLARRGRGLAIGGTILLTASLGGVAALASGAALGGRIDHAVASYTGSDAGYLEAMSSAREQANLRMGVGAVIAVIGAAAGIPLSISGARDLKGARVARKERPTLRIAPGLAALSFTGRF